VRTQAQLYQKEILNSGKKKFVKSISLPYNFTPRDYQLPILKALDSGYKRAIILGHRRMGKDLLMLNYTIKSMAQRIGSYYYAFPQLEQGRKIIWDGFTKSGRKFMNYFPNEIVAHKNQANMKIELTNGSIFQIVGTDHIDNLVGSNAVGVVFSEFALQDPRAWDFYRPILAENDGWAVFISTPRGINHLYYLWEMAQKNKDWYTLKLTVRDTGVLSDEDIEKERQAGMSEDLIQQEFFCSFISGLEGAYYTQYIQRIDEMGQITEVPYDQSKQVYTFWDIGDSDATAVWFVQPADNGGYRFIDYYEASGENMHHYALMLQKKMVDNGYIYGGHFAPWDIQHTIRGTGTQSLLSIAKEAGIDFTPIPRTNVSFGIEQARNVLPFCWFDRVKCERGIDGLRNYQKRWNSALKTFMDIPVHNWASHPADAFRLFAVGKDYVDENRGLSAEKEEELYRIYGARV